MVPSFTRKHGAVLPVLSILVVLLLVQPASASEPIQIEFELSVGGHGSDTGNGVIELREGGFAIVGYVEEENEGKQVSLTRLTTAGEKLWSRTWGGAGDDWGWDLRETEDGGFLVVGFTSSTDRGDEDVLLLRTDGEGEPLWDRRFGGEKDEEAWALELLDDGGAILVAQTESEGAGAEDVYLIRTDKEGRVIWSRTVGGPGTDRVFAITRYGNGLFAVAGISQEKPDSDVDVYVVSFGKDGEVNWDRRYGGKGRDIGHGITTLADGDLLVTGYGDSWGGGSNDVYLMRIDPGGAMRRMTIHGGEGDDRAMMSHLAPDGKIVTIGYTGTRTGLDAMLIGFGSSGNVLWQKVLVRPGNDRGVMVRATRDGGWILTGGFASPPDFDLEIMKLRILAPDP